MKTNLLFTGLKCSTLTVQLLAAFICILPGLTAQLSAQDHEVTVTIDYKKGIDFSKYQTFSFDIAKLMTDQGLIPMPANLPSKQKIEVAIAAQLIKKGLKRNTDNTHPDLHITYVAGVKNKQQAELASKDNDYKNWAPAAWYSDSWNEWWTSEHKEGTIMVDLLDASSDEMVWRAYILSSDVQHGEGCCPDLNKAMTKAFSQYPPKTAKAKTAKQSSLK